MEWLEGGASDSVGQSDVEANVSGLNLHVRRKKDWIGYFFYIEYDLPEEARRGA